MAISSQRILIRRIGPAVIFLSGILLLIIGVGLHYFSSLKGIVQLEQGKPVSLSIDNQANKDSANKQQDLGLMITLDSLIIQPYIPVYEIKLSKKDGVKKQTDYQQGSTYSDLDLFLLEPMKIRVIEKSDLRFRLKEFYPDFVFAYEYPTTRDTITPKAPGITLELKTKEGTPVVTLRSDQPNKNVLGDVVSLGASLAFYWNIPMDSIRDIAAKNESNKIIFSGADSMVYFIFKDSISAQPLKENTFYTLSAEDSSGFRILYCYPDVAYLKAVPSTKGNELLNPVAHVEIWKEGGSAKDAFLYPETASKKGGDFIIPDSDYKLGLSIDKELAKSHCSCTISVQQDTNQMGQLIYIKPGKPGRYHNYSFSPVECKEGHPDRMIMQVVCQPGRFLLMAGYILMGLGLLTYLLKGKERPVRPIY